MSLSQCALTTLEAAKKSLGIESSDTTRDELLELLIDAMSAAAQSYCGRPLVQRAIVSEPHELDGRQITLDNYPAAGLQKVVVNGAEIALDPLELDCAAGVLRLPRRTSGTALVDYTAGVAADTASVPQDIQLAVWKWLETALNREGAEGITREQLGDYVVNYAEQNAWPPPVVRSLLEPYRSERV